MNCYICGKKNCYQFSFPILEVCCSWLRTISHIETDYLWGGVPILLFYRHSQCTGFITFCCINICYWYSTLCISPSGSCFSRKCLFTSTASVCLCVGFCSFTLKDCLLKYILTTHFLWKHFIVIIRKEIAKFCLNFKYNFKFALFH